MNSRFQYDHPTIGEEEGGLVPSGGTTSRTRKQKPKASGGPRRQGSSAKTAGKKAKPERSPGPRGANPKRSQALGKTPGSGGKAKAKAKGTATAGRGGQGKKSRTSVRTAPPR